ncbi:MAG: hypothetical protein Q8N63_05875, partial [Nanoarchaeota archaeon]|nr:hypothetical protein [Nanoarchaeota archaeon]
DVKEKDNLNNGKKGDKGKDKSLIVKDKIKLGFNDLEASGFAVRFYDKRTILIGNVKNKENLWLDPLSSVTGETSDGYIYGGSTTYSTARSTSNSLSTSSLYPAIGQELSNSGSPDYIDNYYVYRLYLDFNTSSIPDNAVVTDVKLSLNVSVDSSITDFNVSIYDFNWTEPIAIGNQEANYDAVGAVFDALWRNTTGISIGNRYNSSSLNNSWINLTGDTKYQLRSDRDVNSNVPTGSEDLQVYSANSAGNEPILYITYNTDSTAPVITIVSPANTTYTTTTINFNVSLSESGSWCGLSLDNAANITMTANSSNTGFGYTNSTMTQGSHSVVFACNDTYGNMNSSSGAKAFTIDTISPALSIIYPANATYNVNVSELNHTSNGVSCWYSNNSGIWNSTPAACGTNFTNAISVEGSNTWTLYANDSSNNINSTSVTFFKDTISPNVAIVSPLNQTYTATTINFNVSLSESGSWCGLSLDGATNITMTANSSNTGFGYTNSTMTQGSHSVVFACNDTAGNMNASS